MCDRVDQVELLPDGDAITAWLEPCGDTGAALAQLTSALPDPATGDLLVGVDIAQGGCLGAWDVIGAYEDGDALHIWMLLDDAAYGRDDVGCTADYGEAHEVHRVSALTGTPSSVDLTIGRWNSELPGSPYGDSEE